MAVALAASLCVMAGRLSQTQMPDAGDLVASAANLRERAAALIDADAAAYAQVMAALRAPRGIEPERRQHEITAALSRAAEVPTELAEIAAAVGAIAARIAESGNRNLLGDVVTAGLLAEAGSRAAAALVSINLQGSPEDERHIRVSRAVMNNAAATIEAQGVVERGLLPPVKDRP
jgi:formiminotetrahydrofolate cyclodeaminase